MGEFSSIGLRLCGKISSHFSTIGSSIFCSITSSDFSVGSGTKTSKFSSTFFLYSSDAFTNSSFGFGGFDNISSNTDKSSSDNLTLETSPTISFASTIGVFGSMGVLLVSFLVFCINLTNICKKESEIIGNIPPAKNAKNLL